MTRKTLGAPCAVCGKPSVARKLCATHYKRLSRHGHIEQTRPTDWGMRDRHPLVGAWRWTKRIGRDHRWNDFWLFIGDVGARPTAKHILRRQNTDRPFGPDNWFWSSPVSENGSGYTKKERAEYARLWRSKNPLRSKDGDLKKMFGISLAEYEEMLNKQDGKCAICRQVDKNFRLAVDHCHTSKKIRGLLCSQCNRGIGMFKDKSELLERAAEYLRWPERLL